MERADRAPVGTFYAPGSWSDVVELSDAAAHHVLVKRLRDGDLVRLTSGDGRRAGGTLSLALKRRVTVTLDDAGVDHVPAPPSIALYAPVGDRDRMLMLAEKATELAVSSWQPVVYRRSRSVTPRGEGSAFREKLRLRMIAALEQSGGAWLPAVHPECTLEELSSDASGASRILLDAGGTPLLDLTAALTSPSAIALGPEGGLEPDERAALVESGWRLASLGANVLRFETAGIAALALLRASLG